VNTALVCAEQLVHGVLAGAGHRLIGRDHDALDDGALSCSGLSATTSCAVEQFGLAMMPRLRKPATASALTSGTISGTSES
jgi:hypothetical protein